MGVVLHAYTASIIGRSTVIRPSFMPIENVEGRPMYTPLITRRLPTGVDAIAIEIYAAFQPRTEFDKYVHGRQKPQRSTSKDVHR